MKSTSTTWWVMCEPSTPSWQYVWHFYAEKLKLHAQKESFSRLMYRFTPLRANFLLFLQLYKLVHNTGHIPTLSICSLDFEFSLEHVSKYNTVSTKARVLWLFKRAKGGQQKVTKYLLIVILCERSWSLILASSQWWIYWKPDFCSYLWLISTSITNESQNWSTER